MINRARRIAGVLVVAPAAVLSAGCAQSAHVVSPSSRGTTPAPSAYSPPTPDASHVICSKITGSDVLELFGRRSAEVKFAPTDWVPGCGWEFDDGRGAHADGAIVIADSESTIDTPPRKSPAVQIPNGVLALLKAETVIGNYTCTAVARFDGRPRAERLKVSTQVNQQAKDIADRTARDPLCMATGRELSNVARGLGWVR
ncbi:MAG: hypothetical protein SW127_15735 [Actinomycetota bacterium]|nr:hypothetical protein [Actinomycetota bacterium]